MRLRWGLCVALAVDFALNTDPPVTRNYCLLNRCRVSSCEVCEKILKVEHSFQTLKRQISGYILRQQKYIKISFYCFPKAITMLTRHKACMVLAEWTAVLTEPPPNVFTPSARAERTRVCWCCDTWGFSVSTLWAQHATPNSRSSPISPWHFKRPTCFCTR